MNAKSSITSIAHQIEKVPARVESARKTLDGWRGRTLRMVKRYPGRSMLGAFAAAFVFAKLTRYL
jgi:hypothetical protein